MIIRSLRIIIFSCGENDGHSHDQGSVPLITFSFAVVNYSPAHKVSFLWGYWIFHYFRSNFHYYRSIEEYSKVIAE